MTANYIKSPWYIIYSLIMGILMLSLSFLNDYSLFSYAFQALALFHFILLVLLIYKRYRKHEKQLLSR
jgi:uncharacterized membrane protein YkvI